MFVGIGDRLYEEWDGDLFRGAVVAEIIQSGVTKSWIWIGGELDDGGRDVRGRRGAERVGDAVAGKDFVGRIGAGEEVGEARKLHGLGFGRGDPGERPGDVEVFVWD